MNGPYNFVIHDEDGCLMFYELTQQQMNEMRDNSPVGELLHRRYMYLLNANYVIESGVLEISGDLHHDSVVGQWESYTLKDYKLKPNDPLINEIRDKYMIGPSRIGPLKKKRFNLSKFKMETLFDVSMIWIRRGRYVNKSFEEKTYKTSNFRIKHNEKEKTQI